VYIKRGLSRTADTRASGPVLFKTPDEAKAETRKTILVPWSHPCRGITGDLGGPLLIYI